MEQIKTRSLRIDGETQEKLVKIERKHFNSGEDGDISFSNLIRFCIDSTYNSLGKEVLCHEELMNRIKGYATVGFLKANTSFDILDEVLCSIDKANEEYYPEEIMEIFDLYNEESPITVGKLIRFKNRSMPEFFLDKLGVDSKEYESLDDVELVDFILNKLKNEEFKKNAQLLFRIEI